MAAPRKLSLAEIEAKEVVEEVKAHSGKEYISLKTSSQALLMASKRQTQFHKGKNFNSFVLREDSEEKDEFSQFLNLLKTSLTQIPANTRMQLAVYVGLSHWVVVDVWISEKTKLNTFILDAAGMSLVASEMSARFKEKFPQGKHYYFKKDEIQLATEARPRQRAIQTEMTGCQVYVREHTKQLAQIDPNVLYAKELPALTNSSGEIVPEKFLEVSKDQPLQLSRIFRSMRRLATLNTLAPEVLNTFIKPGVTVKMSAEEKIAAGISLIKRKSDRYQAKQETFLATHSPQVIKDVMEQRQGMTFLVNPILFALSDALAKATSENLEKFLVKFSEKIQIPMPQSSEVFFKPVATANFYLEELESFVKTKPEKFTVLLSMAGLFKALDDENRMAQKTWLNDILAAAIPILRNEPAAEAKLGAAPP